MSKCDNCRSKSNELKIFQSKLIDGKCGNFCDICYLQNEDKDNKQINELTKRNLDLSLYLKGEKKIPTAIPITPQPTIIINLDITNNYNNNTTNNFNDITNNITKNKYCYDKDKKVDDNQDKKGAKLEEIHKKMLKEEEYRIQKQKEMRNKRDYYNKCCRCKKTKHYSAFKTIEDHNGEPTKYGNDLKNEEGEPMYLRTNTCLDCLDYKKEKAFDDKELNKLFKEENTYKCACGGKYFLGNNPRPCEYDRLRHERTKQHMEYNEKQKLKDGSNVNPIFFNRNFLRDVCKLNKIKGYNNMTKEETINAIQEKQKELRAINKDILWN
jgi:hypothetical protein